MLRERNVSIDIAKGLGILCIVIWHLQGCSGTESELLHFLKYFVCQFHVPLFFFISGLFFRETQPWPDFLKKKFVRIYLPFVIANAIFVYVESYLHMLGGDPFIFINSCKWVAKICLGLSWTNMGGATWFLLALFRIMILYKLLYCLCRGNKLLILILSVALSISGIYATNDYCIANTLYFFVFFAAGHIIGSLGKIDEKPRYIVNAVFVIVLSVVLSYTSISGLAEHIKPLLMKKIAELAIAGLGVVFMLNLSKLLVEVRYVREFFSFLGRNTMSVLIGHFAAFKLLVVVQVLIAGVSLEYLKSHPCYSVSFPWSLVYLVIGIALPIVVSLLWGNAKKRIEVE